MNRKFFKIGRRYKNFAGFTLLELLVVISVLSVLATALILVLNPTEYMKQSRDAKRVLEISGLDKAINLYSMSNSAMGDPQKVYVSLPDDSSVTCDNLGLPPLAPGYDYNCVALANLENFDGTGWLPMDFRQIVGVSMPTLPVDLSNSADSILFYAYVTESGRWALAISPESQKFLKRDAANDGGVDPVRVEKGSDISLWMKAQGLVRYWKFDEGVGSIASDSSGNEDNAGWSVTAPPPYWFSPAKAGQSAGRIRRSGGTLSFTTTDALPDSKITVSLWANNITAVSGSGSNVYVYAATDWNPVIGAWSLHSTSDQGVVFRVRGGLDALLIPSMHDATGCSSQLTSDDWHFIAGTYDGNTVRVYLDGNECGNTGLAGMALATTNLLKTENKDAVRDLVIDDMRVYNRALSAAEIKKIYDAQK